MMTDNERYWSGERERIETQLREGILDNGYLLELYCKFEQTYEFYRGLESKLLSWWTQELEDLIGETTEMLRNEIFRRMSGSETNGNIRSISTVIYYVGDFCEACNVTLKEVNEVFAGEGPTESVFLNEMEDFIDECQLMISEGEDAEEIETGKRRLEIINKILAARDAGVIESNFVLQWDY